MDHFQTWINFLSPIEIPARLVVVAAQQVGISHIIVYAGVVGLEFNELLVGAVCSSELTELVQGSSQSEPGTGIVGTQFHSLLKTFLGKAVILVAEMLLSCNEMGL